LTVKDLRRPGRPKSLICKDLGPSQEKWRNNLTNQPNRRMFRYGKK
jgi:hypothetical protein